MGNFTTFAHTAYALIQGPLALGEDNILTSSWRKLTRRKPLQLSTRAIDAYRGVIVVKVGRIDRLPSKYRKEAIEIVWSAVMRGYDDAGLVQNGACRDRECRELGKGFLERGVGPQAPLHRPESRRLQLPALQPAHRSVYRRQTGPSGQRTGLLLPGECGRAAGLTDGRASRPLSLPNGNSAGVLRLCVNTIQSA
jgi:hypothetical protein